jgi:hypothetical protein
LACSCGQNMEQDNFGESKNWATPIFSLTKNSLILRGHLRY